jgi:hypothetical protein
MSQSDSPNTITSENETLEITVNRPRKFFPHPNQLTIAVGEGSNRHLESIVPFVQPTQYVDVIDIGQNKSLQKDVTQFFYNKTLKWIHKYPEFAHLKKYYNFLRQSKGFEYIYGLLRLFVRHSKANWYDLRSRLNYPIIKNFIRHKIGNI